MINMDFQLETFGFEIEALWDQSQGRGKQTKINKEFLERLLMDHAKMVTVLGGFGIIFKEPEL